MNKYNHQYKAAIVALLCVFMLFGAMGCGGKEITTLDHAKAVDKGLMNSWLTLADTYTDLYMGAEDLRPFLSEKVKPALTVARSAILTYNDAVLQWAELGEDYADIPALFKKAWAKLTAVQTLFGEVGTTVELIQPEEE